VEGGEAHEREVELTHGSLNGESPSISPRERAKDEANLPMLFGKVAEPTLVRKLHKKLKHFEYWGYQSKEDKVAPKKSNKFQWRTFFLGVLRWIFFPLLLFYYLFSPKLSWKLKLSSTLLAIFYVGCIAFPITNVFYRFHDEAEGMKGLLYSPSVIFFILILILSTIEGKQTKQRNQLSSFFLLFLFLIIHLANSTSKKEEQVHKRPCKLPCDSASETGQWTLCSQKCNW
jgi:hypothetical protein